MGHFEFDDGGLIFARLALGLLDELAVASAPRFAKLRLEGIFLRIQFHAFLVIIAVSRAGLDFGNHGFDGRLGATGKNPAQRVIVLCWYRIEFVVVAAGAGDGEPEKAFGDDVDAIIENIVGHAHEAITEGEKAQRGEISGIAGSGRKFIGGDLFENEKIVRLVLIEAANDVIAISPGEQEIGILTLTADLAFGVAVAS